MPYISIPWIEDQQPLPRSELALANGLVAAGADLSTSRLLEAYALGLFPWFNAAEPILWWSPDPRAVLACQQFKLSKSLAKLCRRIARTEFAPDGEFKITTNCDFLAVIRHCAQLREHQQGTWISRDIIHAYYQLHLQQHAHSIEVWQNQQLVGGLYGVQLGRFFFGESMFSLVNNASKVALYYLTRYLLSSLAIEHIDCQQRTPHLTSLGAIEVPRAQFNKWLSQTSTQPLPQPWGQGQLCAQGYCHPVPYFLRSTP